MRERRRRPAPPPFDRGLQGERTAMAWWRTGLAVAANALLLLKSGVAEHRLATLLVGVTLLGAALAVLVAGSLRRRTLTAGTAPAVAARTLGGVAWVATGAALGAAWLLSTGPH